MHKTSPKRLYAAYYSIVCFVIAEAFVVDNFLQTGFDLPGWIFRYLTIWGLWTACIAHAYLALTRLQQKHSGFLATLSAVSTLNVMVVYLYWRLYFTNPALVSDGTSHPIREYYLHLLGPILIVIEAIFISKTFQTRLWLKSTMIIMSICVLYVLWLELYLGPMGRFPYPFLRNMDVNQRLIFYTFAIMVAVIIHGLSWLLARVYEAWLDKIQAR
ncbi:MAG: hypothetical protein VXY77_03920 [Pseudomonadota bacterium]|nr:hypothetical protein [Pseudomonadota bacterium]